jgi:hypothetical protein
VDFTKHMCAAVLQQLQDTWEMTLPDLKLVANTIHVEETVRSQVVVEIHKKLQSAPKTPKQPKQKRSRDADSHALEDTLFAASLANQSSMDRYFHRYERAVDSHRRT